MHTAPAPQPRELLPPLLACLPTAFVSQRPPPALLPLLSPILRQRVSLLSTTTNSSSNWLTLLSWDSSRASKLPSKVEGLQLEPHPVSGEIEISDVKSIRYRRLDEETLHACLDVDEFELLPVYLWCESDEHAGGGAGWRLAELRALEDKEDGTRWYGSITEATDAFESETHPVNGSQANGTTTNGHSAAGAHQQEEEEDDDDYWASYDRTPGRTPARTPAKRSPDPNANTTTAAQALLANNRKRSTSELEYFARYASEVQPAMDGHDPDEEVPGKREESTLNHHASEYHRQQPPQQEQQQQRQQEVDEEEEEEEEEPPNQRVLFQHEPLDTTNPGPNGHDSPLPPLDDARHAAMHSPRPTSPSSQGSVERLEAGAEEMTRAEVGVKQFVSTEVKSLFRLARSVGIDRQEFERIVRTELDVLGMMEEE